MTKPIRIFSLAMGMMVFLLATGCATVGKDFSSSAAETIVINKTTIDDIRNMLGEPWRTGIEDGQKTWTYGYYQYRLFGQSDTKDLIIRFNADNTVASYTFNTTR